MIIGRVGVGKLQYLPTPLELDSFCRNLIEEIKFSKETHHKIEFETAIDHSQKPELVNIDGNLLRHIISNLLDNAVKYSPDTEIIDFKLSYKYNTVTFEIIDSGIGIPLEEQTKLFYSFYRATNVGKISGTGVGLAIVKQCVDLHQGVIAFNSEEGKGTTFTITLPINCSVS